MADQLLGLDGTQEPPPPAPLPDPLAGLLTGEVPPAVPETAAVGPAARSTEGLSTEGLLADAAEIRRQVDAALAAEDRSRQVGGGPVARGRADRAGPTQVLHPWPSSRLSLARSLPDLLRSTPRRGSRKGVGLTAESGFPAGALVVIVMMAVAVVIAYYLVRSLIDSISEMFT